MASNVNVVALTGNLTRDPETREAGSTTVTSLRLAVNDRRKVNDEWTDVPGYYDVIVWGGRGETAARYLSKGSPVAVSGRLSWREWQDAEGNKRQAVDVVAENVQFLSQRDGGDSGGSVTTEQPETDPGF